MSNDICHLHIYYEQIYVYIDKDLWMIRFIRVLKVKKYDIRNIFQVHKDYFDKMHVRPSKGSLIYGNANLHPSDTAKIFRKDCATTTELTLLDLFQRARVVSSVVGAPQVHLCNIIVPKINIGNFSPDSAQAFLSESITISN